MAAPSIRGHQGRIKVLRNGGDTGVIHLTNFEANMDSNFLRTNYVGNPLPEGDQSIEGWSGSFDTEVKDGTMDDIVDAIVSGQLAGIGIDDFALVEDEYYPNGTIRSYVYFDVQMRLSKRKPGQTEKQTKRMDWQASGRQRLR